MVSGELDLSSKCALSYYLKPGNPRWLISGALATPKEQIVFLFILSGRRRPVARFRKRPFVKMPKPLNINNLVCSCSYLRPPDESPLGATVHPLQHCQMSGQAVIQAQTSSAHHNPRMSRLAKREDSTSARWPTFVSGI